MSENQTFDTKESRAAYLQSEAYKHDYLNRVLAKRLAEENDDERKVSEYFSARQRAQQMEKENNGSLICLETALYYIKQNSPKEVAARMCRNDLQKFTANEISQCKKALEFACHARIEMRENAYLEMECDRETLLNIIADNQISMLNLRQIDRNPIAVNELRTLAMAYKAQMN